MATRVYRNADVSKVFVTQIPQQIAQLHKDVAKEYTAARGFRDNFSVFAFRRYQRAKKYDSIDAIPIKALYLPASIGINTSGGENPAVEIATEFVHLFYRMAPVNSGEYRSSLRLTLNGRMRALSSLQKIQEFNPLKSAEIVEIWSAVEYASTLEAPNYNIEGIFLKITRMLLAKWASKAAIRFTYRSGQKMGLAFKYATPVLMISARGEFASSTTTRRGYQMRKRKRALAKVNKSRKAAGRRPLKRLRKR